MPRTVGAVTADGLEYQPSRTPTVGDPVSVGSGEEQWAMNLFNLPGPMPVQVSLHYLSQFYMPTDMGDQWYLNVPALWLAGTNRLSIPFINGLDEVEFAYTNGAWQVNDKAAWPYELAVSSHTNYYVRNPADNTVLYFERVNDFIGVCRMRTDRNGNSLYYEYTTNYAGKVTPALTCISNEFGAAVDVTMTLHSNRWLVTRMQSRGADPQTWTFGFTPSGFDWHLTSITNPAGDRFSCTYASSGAHLTAVEFPKGNVPYASGYAALNGSMTYVVTAQTNAVGGVTRIEYDITNGVTTEIRPDGLTNRYVTTMYSNEAGRVSGAPEAFAFAGSGPITFAQDSAGNVTNGTTAGGATFARQFDPESGQLSGLSIGTNAPLESVSRTVTQRFYGLDGTYADFTFRDTVTNRYPDGTHDTIEVDERGNITAYVNAVSSRWTYAYNAVGLLTNEVNPAGARRQFRYNANGWLTSLEDDATGTTTYEYDGAGRLIRQTDTLGHSTSVGLDANGLPVAITNALSQVTRYTRNANGSVTAADYPDGSRAGYTYDAMDRMTAATNSLGQRMSVTYDIMGRLATRTGIDGTTEHFFYDAAGHLTNYTRNAYTWSGQYDADGMLTSEVSSASIAASYAYNIAGQPVRAEDAAGRVWQYAYDAMGQLVHSIDPDGRTNAYAYDADGQLVAVTLPGDRAAAYTRNPLGALASITEPGGGQWTLAYTPDGLLTNKTDPLGHATIYAYTPRGQIAVIQPPSSDPVHCAYDAAGKLTNLTAGSIQQAYQYDAVGRLTGANGISACYDLAGRVTQYVSGAVTCALDWNLSNQLTSVTVTPPGVAFNYSYNSDGHVETIEDSLFRGRATFRYDDAGRVTNIVRGNAFNCQLTWDNIDGGRITALSDGPFVNAQYSFDTLGRVTSVVGTLPVNIGAELVNAEDAWGMNAMNQITNAPWSWSDRGELLTAPAVTCRWDALSRLAAVNGVTNTFDAAGRLLTSDDPAHGAAIQYSYCDALDPQIPLTIENPSEGTSIQAIVPGWGLVYSIVAGPGGTNVIYYHYDARGSVVTTTDGDGNQTGRYGYTPYGRLINPDSTEPPPFQFLGRHGCQWVEGSDTLYRHGARCYHPETGRFISPEPDWPDIVNPVRLNIYNYAASDPVNYVDYDGLMFSLNTGMKAIQTSGEQQKTQFNLSKTFEKLLNIRHPFNRAADDANVFGDGNRLNRFGHDTMEEIENDSNIVKNPRNVVGHNHAASLDNSIWVEYLFNYNKAEWFMPAFPGRKDSSALIDAALGEDEFDVNDVVYDRNLFTKDDIEQLVLQAQKSDPEFGFSTSGQMGWDSNLKCALRDDLRKYDRKKLQYIQQVVRQALLKGMGKTQK